MSIADREKSFVGEPPRGAEDELVARLAAAHEAAQPGRRTLIERELRARLEAADEAAGAGARAPRRWTPGRRTLTGAADAGAAEEGAPPRAWAYEVTPGGAGAGAATTLDGLRGQALREVLAALAARRGGRALMAAAVAAATRATRAPGRALTGRPSPPDPAGQAMWQAAERRAATLYRRATGGPARPEDPAVEEALRRIGGGQALPEGVRRAMERALGAPLGRVRVHTDEVAAAAARAVRAEAFTVGEDVFFAAGAFAPDTERGARLLAHELAHVVQAWQGRTEAVAGEVRVASPGDALEREAEAVAERARPAAGVDAPSAEAGEPAAAEGEPGDAAAIARAGIAGGGEALPYREEMERAFGVPLGGVTAHTGEAAAAASAAIGAEAFTSGARIAFGTATPSRALVAHELTHVIQQRAGAVPAGVGAAGDRLEREADEVAAEVAAGRAVDVAARYRAGGAAAAGGASRAAGAVQRYGANDTVEVIGAARRLARAGAPPSQVAEALGSLDAQARHQVLTSWRTTLTPSPAPPDPVTGRPMTREAYYERVAAALRGIAPPAPAAPGTAPTLDLVRRLPAQTDAVYEYFHHAFGVLGYTFLETAPGAARPTLNVINIRRHDLTRTDRVAPDGTPRAPRTTVREMNGQMFIVWRDGAGAHHVETRQWSTTGPGAHKQHDAQAHRDQVMQGAGLATRADARSGTTATTATDAAGAVHDAEGAVTTAETAAQQAYEHSAQRASAATTQPAAEAAMTQARQAHRLASDALALARQIRTPRGAPPAPELASARALQGRATAAFNRARDAWVIARLQNLANTEETAFARMTAARERLEAIPADDPAQATARATAQADFDREHRAYATARSASNDGQRSDGNRGEMSEANAVAWLREGQYQTQRREVHGHQRFAVNAGTDGAHDASGFALVDRDWNANGVIDPGERDLPGTAIGSGVQIHQGGNPTASIGCQVSPDFDDLDRLVSASDSRDSFHFTLIEAEHLPAWNGPPLPGAAAAPGGTGATPPAPAAETSATPPTPAVTPATEAPRHS